jgi:hypothetical protein
MRGGSIKRADVVQEQRASANILINLQLDRVEPL